MKNSRIITALLVTIFALASANGQQLILWNKMESSGSVAGSIVGGPGTIYGTMSYAAGQFGNGAHSDAAQSGVWFQSQDFTGLEDRGTVEFWFKSDYSSATIPMTRILSVEGEPRNSNGGGGIINLYFSSGVLNVQLSYPSSATTIPVPFSFNAGELHHLAVTWNKDKIDGINTTALYYDGVCLMKSNVPFTFLNCQAAQGVSRPDLTSGNGVVALFLNGYDANWKGFASTSDHFIGIIDNVKVWNGSKTDFSDRFTEGTNAAVVSAASNLIFWNKLGSLSEVQNSEVGPGGTIVGPALFEAAQFGFGFQRLMASGNYPVFPNVINNGNVFTVEFWAKTPFAVPAGISTSVFHFILTNANGFFAGMCIDQSGQFNASTGNPAYKSLYRWTGYSWPAGELHHIAMVYNNAGGSGAYIKFYFDGALQTVTSMPADATWTMNLPLSLKLGEDSGNTHDSVTIDNVKIYGYAKTDFSDRFTEGTNAVANAAPSISVVQPDGVSDSADASFNIQWTDSDPDNNASISLYYDSNNSGYDGTLIASALSEDAEAAGDAYSWNTSAIPNGTYYLYAVIDDGVNTAVEAYSSGPVTVNHPAPPPTTNVPAAPSGLQSTAGSEVVNLNWNDVIGAVSYNVYRSETSGFTLSAGTLIGSSSGHTSHDTAVNNDTRYYYVVTAVNTNGESLPSNEVWATPGHQQHNLLLKNNRISASRGGKVTMSYVVDKNAKVKIRILDASGNLVDETAELYLPVGSFEQDWAGTDTAGKTVPPGVYTMQLFVDDQLIDTQRAIVAK